MITTDLRPLTPPDAQEPQWLLPGLLPKGELVILEGAPGVGKSLLAAALAAQVSRDGACTLVACPGESADTLRTHLARQTPNYDTLRELAWSAYPEEKKKPQAEEAEFHLEDHLQNHKPALLVIDSLEESLCVLSGEPERRLRWFWSTLVMLARRYGTTILVLTRPRGGRGTARVARTAAEAAKAVFTLSWHPADPSLRVLTRTRDLLSPAGAQWHLTIAPDGHADWAEADDPVPPAAGPITHHAAPRTNDLPRVIRAIEETLTGPMPAVALRHHLLQQGFSAHAFRTALRCVDVEYKKLGSVWVYQPGPELALLQELRRTRSERPPTTPSPSPAKPFPAPSTDRPPLPDAEVRAKLELHRRTGRKFNAVREACFAEVGRDVALDVFQHDTPGPARDRCNQLFDAFFASLTPDEMAALQEMEHALELQEQEEAKKTPCCVRAHATS